MKKVLILIAFITLPVLTFGQNTSSDTLKVSETDTLKTVNIPIETKKQLAFNAYSKIDVLNMSYKKSNDLISIKAYRKSLQIKVREIKNS